MKYRSGREAADVVARGQREMLGGRTSRARPRHLGHGTELNRARGFARERIFRRFPVTLDKMVPFVEGF
jgi:hypothetical protein